jgi:phosphoribosylglycinamide formyltransferase-1
MTFMRVVILGSGRGSNAEAILQAQQEGRLGRARVVQIISDRSDARILELGHRFGVAGRFLDPGPFKTKFDEAGEARYIEFIRGCEPGLIVLAGFMRILRPRFIDAFPCMIINLHPSLLPSFPGLDGIGQAWRHGVRVTGCTVHRVTSDVDCGPIIDQTAVRITPEDTLETLETRVHAAEHALLPAVITRISEAKTQNA